MQKSLGCRAIGIEGASLAESLNIARQSGFDAIAFDVREAAELAGAHGIDHVAGLLQHLDSRRAREEAHVRHVQNAGARVIEAPLSELAQQHGPREAVECHRSYSTTPAASR